MVRRKPEYQKLNESSQSLSKRVIADLQARTANYARVPSFDTLSQTGESEMSDADGWSSRQHLLESNKVLMSVGVTAKLRQRAKRVKEVALLTLVRVADALL